MQGVPQWLQENLKRRAESGISDSPMAQSQTVEPLTQDDQLSLSYAGAADWFFGTETQAELSAYYDAKSRDLTPAQAEAKLAEEKAKERREGPKTPWDGLVAALKPVAIAVGIGAGLLGIGLVVWRVAK